MPETIVTDHEGVRSSLVDPIGREHELALLRSALVPGGAVLILGGKGMGKSTLLEAAGHMASATGFSTGLASLTERKGSRKGESIESASKSTGEGSTGSGRRDLPPP